MSENIRTLTAVIPTLNDETVIRATITRALDDCNFDEVIVVDGGSSDGTCGIAEAMGARVIHTDAIRGRQLDDGWKAAVTDLICFLRADSVLPITAGDEIQVAFQDHTVTLTSFRLGFRSRKTSLALLAAWFNFRAIFLGRPTGIQGITVRRDDLMALGGIPYWHDCEDFYLISNMRRRGRVCTLSDHVYISGKQALRKGALSVFLNDIREAIFYTRHKIPSYLRK